MTTDSFALTGLTFLRGLFFMRIPPAARVGLRPTVLDPELGDGSEHSSCRRGAIVFGSFRAAGGRPTLPCGGCMQRRWACTPRHRSQPRVPLGDRLPGEVDEGSHLGWGRAGPGVDRVERGLGPVALEH